MSNQRAASGLARAYRYTTAEAINIAEAMGVAYDPSTETMRDVVRRVNMRLQNDYPNSLARLRVFRKHAQFPGATKLIYRETPTGDVFHVIDRNQNYAAEYFDDHGNAHLRAW